MGLVKAHMQEMEALGLSGGEGGDVCGECIGDSVLARFIADNASENSCSYCERKEPTDIACPLGEVVEFMARVINEEYTDPANELPYITREGGYQGQVLDPWELLEAIGFEPNHHDIFEHAATYLMGHDWCRADYYSSTPEERFRFGWHTFCREVKHARRYTFWTAMDDGNPEYHPDHLPPGRMLAEIEEVITELSLIEEFPPGAQFWRVQEHAKGEILEFPTRFTSPPLEFATQPNRMSPGGIPMFYGAEDFETAVLEVSGREPIKGREASGVAFEALRPMKILDLVAVRRGVSYFSEQGRMWNHRSGFLRFFSQDISKPLQRDHRQHIEYVPTQVFTEYVRYQMSARDGKPIDGIRYRSSLNHQPCYVLFFDQDDCLRSRDEQPQSVQAVSGSMKTLSLEHPRR